MRYEQDENDKKKEKKGAGECRREPSRQARGIPKGRKTGTYIRRTLVH